MYSVVKDMFSQSSIFQKKPLVDQPYQAYSSMALNVLAPSSNRMGLVRHKQNRSLVPQSKTPLLKRDPSYQIPIFENKILHATTASHHKISSQDSGSPHIRGSVDKTILECKGRYITPKIMVMKKAISATPNLQNMPLRVTTKDESQSPHSGLNTIEKTFYREHPYKHSI